MYAICVGDTAGGVEVIVSSMAVTTPVVPASLDEVGAV